MRDWIIQDAPRNESYRAGLRVCLCPIVIWGAAEGVAHIYIHRYIRYEVYYVHIYVFIRHVQQKTYKYLRRETGGGRLNYYFGGVRWQAGSYTRIVTGEMGGEVILRGSIDKKSCLLKL